MYLRISNVSNWTSERAEIELLQTNFICQFNTTLTLTLNVTWLCEPFTTITVWWCNQWAGYILSWGAGEREFHRWVQMITAASGPTSACPGVRLRNWRCELHVSEERFHRTDRHLFCPCSANHVLIGYTNDKWRCRCEALLNHVPSQ